MMLIVDRGRGWAQAGVLLDLVFAALIGAVRALNTGPGQGRAEGPWASVAFAVVYAGPGLVALVGLTSHRRALVGAGGLACYPLAILSVVAFPLAIVGLLLLIGFGRRPPRAWGRTLVALPTFLVAIIAAIPLLLPTADYSFQTVGYGESGEYVPFAHAALAMVLVLIGVAAATAVASGGPADRG
jgi:hypothetical protein